MRIITYTILSDDDTEIVHALTEAEYSESPHLLDDYEDYVWQDQPTKEAAIARHYEAMEAWRDAGSPVDGVF